MLMLSPTVHPHARGEQIRANARVSSSTGSSPRTWGTGPTRCSFPLINTVHPHARGEQALKAVCASRIHGSSPRTWGTALGVHALPKSLRFIPTHVGNRVRVTAGPVLRSVHPHARGEQPCAAACTQPCRGSSPRTWGTGPAVGFAVLHTRFIPTHVGNSCQQPSICRALPVHPHARGEQRYRRPQPFLSGRFIPTHVGNRPDRRQRLVECRRFIPTHVGNSAAQHHCAGSDTVHPHARGEQST